SARSPPCASSKWLCSATNAKSSARVRGEQFAHGVDGVGFRGTLVGAITLHTCKPQRQTRGVLRAFLNLVERNFNHDFRPHVHGIRVACNLELEQLLRLPLQHLVGQPLEGLPQHDELSTHRIACAEMQVGQPPAPPPMSPLGSEDYEVQCMCLL